MGQVIIRHYVSSRLGCQERLNQFNAAGKPELGWKRGLVDQSAQSTDKTPRSFSKDQKGHFYSKLERTSPTSGVQSRADEAFGTFGTKSRDSCLSCHQSALMNLLYDEFTKPTSSQ